MNTILENIEIEKLQDKFIPWVVVFFEQPKNSFIYSNNMETIHMVLVQLCIKNL